MSRYTIGVDVDSFPLSPKNALRQAADLGFHDVEFSTVQGDVAPWNLSSSGRRHLFHYVDSLGLRCVALIADFPGLRFTNPRTVDQRVTRTSQVLQLAADLKVPLVVSSVGAMTDGESGEPLLPAVEALQQVGQQADRYGVGLALCPLWDSGPRIVRLLSTLSCPSIVLGLDPGALVMAGANPMSSIERFIMDIRLVQVRDGQAGTSDQPGSETRLGDGCVDWVGLGEILHAADFTGPYMVRRYDSRNPLADVVEDRDLLLRFLSR